jgi:AcrR family transcriptional regulator
VEADRLITGASLRAVDGRVPGRRGRATRQRLLDATREVLESTAFRELKVVDIARLAGTSPATFYQYFPDIEAALLSLARELAETGGAELRGLVEHGDWTPAAAYGTAQQVAEGYLALWEQHRALIGVIDLAALEGDGRFRELRTALLSGATSALQHTIASSIEAGHLPADTDVRARSGVLVSMLAHVAAHARGLSVAVGGTPSLRDEMARIIAWSVTGGAHRPHPASA